MHSYLATFVSTIIYSRDRTSKRDTQQSRAYGSIGLCLSALFIKIDPYSENRCPVIVQQWHSTFHRSHPAILEGSYKFACCYSSFPALPDSPQRGPTVPQIQETSDSGCFLRIQNATVIRVLTDHSDKRSYEAKTI